MMYMKVYIFVLNSCSAANDFFVVLSSTRYAGYLIRLVVL